MNYKKKLHLEEEEAKIVQDSKATVMPKRIVADRDGLPSWRHKPAPEYLTEAILLFLDKTREGGEVNMFGSGPLVQDNFTDLTSSEARKCVTYWMETFSERHP
jgi:hypothetical protein